ncbi:MAG: hypothetical protein R6T83_09065 [Salinibacter sp.]
MVRILLALAFGLAFGIEGMTLIRSFLVDQEEDSTEQTTDARPVLREGDVLAPALSPSVRVQRIRVRAHNDEWTFALTARPDSIGDRSYTVTFDRIALEDGTELTSAPNHTWAPADTAAFTASWALPVGQRPASVTITASSQPTADSTATTTRTVDLGHVPVRQQ